MSDINLHVNDSGQLILFEVTIEVRNLALKMLFNQPPTVEVVCEKVFSVFNESPNVALGMTDLIYGVFMDDKSLERLEVGTEVPFMDGNTQIGFLDLKTRTLFRA